MNCTLKKLSFPLERGQQRKIKCTMMIQSSTEDYRLYFISSHYTFKLTYHEDVFIEFNISNIGLKGNSFCTARTLQHELQFSPKQLYFNNFSGYNKSTL